MIDRVDDDGDELYHYRAEVFWWYLSYLKLPRTDVKRFMYRLCIVAE